MVELNSTVFPLLGPIGTLVNTIKVLIGGVFGLYLIILYLRWREYIIVKRLLTDIKSDIHQLAAKQGVDLEPALKKETLGMKLKKKLRQKPELFKAK